MKLKRYQQATGRDIHVNVPLSNMAIAYRPEGMIADLIAPVVTVMKQSDSYWVFSAQDAFRTEDDKRAPGTEARIISRSVSTDTYFADNYALKDRIPYEDLENADAATVVTERQARAEFVTDKLYLNKELRVVNQVTSGSNVGSYSAVASAWTDYTSGNSDPIGNINTAINNVEDLTGYRPNNLVFGGYAWRHFREHAGVIDRIYGNAMQGPARTVTRENAKALFEVDRVLVGGVYRSTTEEGQAKSLSQLWFDNVLAYYAPASPEKKRPSFMYSFRWKKIMNMQAKVWQLERAHAEEVEVGYYEDEKITASELAFLITGVGSSQ
jgi:hypothetical protein